MENIHTPNQSDSSESAINPLNDDINLMDDFPEIPDNVREQSDMSEATASTDSVWSEESVVLNILVSREMEELRQWAIEINISHEQLNKLLPILRRRVLPDLPKTGKTLLKTSTAQYRIVEMEDANGNSGQFVYFTLRKGIENCVNPKNSYKRSDRINYKR